MAIKEQIEEAVPLILRELAAAQALADAAGDDTRAEYKAAREAVEAHEVARRMYRAACFRQYEPGAETETKPAPAVSATGNGESVTLPLPEFRKLVTDLEAARNLLIESGDHGRRLADAVLGAEWYIGNLEQGFNGAARKLSRERWLGDYKRVEEAESLYFFGRALYDNDTNPPISSDP